MLLCGRELRILRRVLEETIEQIELTYRERKENVWTASLLGCYWISAIAFSTTPLPCASRFISTLRKQQQDQQRPGDNRWYRTIDDGTSAGMTSAEAKASRLWNASFTDAILGESVGLVNRPTAMKGMDGKWEGVVATPTATAERRTAPTAARDVHPQGAAGWCGEWVKMTPVRSSCDSRATQDVCLVLGVCTDVSCPPV